MRTSGGTEDVDTHTGIASSDVNKKAGDNQLYNAMLVSLQENEDLWEASVIYGGDLYDMSADNLLPCEQPTEKKKQDVTKLEKFDFETIAGTQLHLAAMHVLNYAFLMTFDAVNGVVVEVLGDRDKPPYKLQVRASRKFKAKEIVFVPYSGGDGILLKSSDPENRKRSKPDKSTMAPETLCRAVIKVRGLDRSKKKEEATTRTPKEHFVSISPLFFARKDDFKVETVQPFWAMTRTREPKKHNMTMEFAAFEDLPPLPLPGERMPSPFKKSLYAAEVQVCRNHRKVEPGELLHLGMMEDQLDDSEGSDCEE